MKDTLLQLEQSNSTRFAIRSCGSGQLDFQDWVVRFGGKDEKPVPVPSWFIWAVRLAFSVKSRDIAGESPLTFVVTTPCDSAVAGAIAFGACMFSVPSITAVPDTADLFDKFMASEPGTELKRLPIGSEKRTQKYRLLTERSEQHGIAMKTVSGKNKNGVHFITRNNANCFAFVDEEADTNRKTLTPYVGLPLMHSLLGEHAKTRNWQCNLDSVTLCAPSAGAAAIRHATDQIYFSDIIEELDVDGEYNRNAHLSPARRLTLTDLLAVSDWHSITDRESPHYCQFINACNANRDDFAPKSNLVVFNGPDAYLRLHTRFSSQTQIVVVSRDCNPSKLDHFMDQTHGIRMDSQDVSIALPTPPFGIQLMCVGARIKRAKQW